MTDVNITNLNFTEIEDSIKAYLRTQDTFKDYNFEGSVISTIIKTLAYNTYLNSYYVNMAANEAFLDTAQIRQNIISSSKMLGYMPKSSRASVAQVELQFLPLDSPDEITVPRYSRFNATLDNVDYTFITNQDYTIPNAAGIYRKIVDIYEGNSYTYRYTFDGNTQFFKILDPKIDTETLEVYVRTNSSSTDRIEYLPVDDITQIGADSTVYFLQESFDGRYEIYFGDGVLGKNLDIGNIVEITGIVCSGSVTNGIRVISGQGVVGYNSENISITYQPTISLISEAQDGQDQETIKNIKFSAPKQYAAQKRLVTADDYQNYLISKYSDIQSVSVWGGENNDPPLYGRVLISAKVNGSFVLSNFKKNQIIDEFGSRNALTVRPYIIDPIFTFIKPEVIVYFDSSKTTLDSQGILNRVSTAISNFEEEGLSKFSSAFYLSKFSTAIDAADTSVVNNSTTILLEKRFTPNYGSSFTYKIKFNESLRNLYPGYLGCLNSTGFKLTNTSQDYFHYFDDDGNGVVRIYRLDGENREYIFNNAGTIDYDSGEIKLVSVSFTEIENTSEEVKLFVEPFSNTYTPKRNEILLLSAPLVTVIDTKKQIITRIGVVEVQGDFTPITTSSLVDVVNV